MFQTVGQLSGGEKAKAALARLSATGANLLVMDEPTNHLDIWSCEALERSIREFEGTVLVVSHDRYFLNQVADRLIVVAGGQARVIEGDYETYQRLAQQEARRRRPGQDRDPRPPPPPRRRPDKPEKRKRKFPYRKSADLEREIAEVEVQVAELEDLLGQPATWRDPIKAVSTQQRHEDLKRDAGPALRTLGRGRRIQLVNRYKRKMHPRTHREKGRSGKRRKPVVSQNRCMVGDHLLRNSAKGLVTSTADQGKVPCLQEVMATVQRF